MTESPSPLDALATLDLRVGRVISAEVNAGARVPAYVLEIDFGPLGTRTSSAQLTTRYTPAALRDKLVIAAVNLGTRKIAGVKSEVLVLGLPDEHNDVVLLTADANVPPGGRVY